MILIIKIRDGHFRTSAPRTGTEPQFRCGIDDEKRAEKRCGMEGAEPPKITSAPLHRQKIISIWIAIFYYRSLNVWKTLRPLSHRRQLSGVFTLWQCATEKSRFSHTATYRSI